jgi:lysophospholipase L1-like esterase
MRLRLFGIVLMLALALGAVTTAPAADFFYRDGDKPVVFLGDSITDGAPYPKMIEAYILTRFPKWDVTFRNIGWSGDTAGLRTRGGFDNGMKRDVMPLKPMAMTIDFGMNDARGGEGAYAGYVENSTKLVKQLKAAGVRVALCTPSPEERYEEGQPAGSAYNKMLWKYSQGLKEVAEKEGVVFVDQYTPFVKVIEDGRVAGVLSKIQGGNRLIPDGVHPNMGGHLVMASSILKGLNAPALVSSVEIDATTKKVTAQKACTVEMVDGADLSFKRTDEALPWPVANDAQFILKTPGFTPMDDLNSYILKVTNLTNAKYTVMIDDVKAATYTKEELANGVNMALNAGPVTAQSNKIWGLVNDKGGLYFNRWRNVQIYSLPAWCMTADIETARKTELDRIDVLIADKEKQINEMRKIVSHVWKLVADK